MWLIACATVRKTDFIWSGAGQAVVKVAQINYVSRNQLDCTANLNFGLMCKKAKNCWALSTNFISVQLIVFFECKNSNHFKKGCMAKWLNETELQAFDLYQLLRFRVHYILLFQEWLYVMILNFPLFRCMFTWYNIVLKIIPIWM